jgi:hypothetical protein
MCIDIQSSLAHPRELTFISKSSHFIRISYLNHILSPDQKFQTI